MDIVRKYLTGQKKIETELVKGNFPDEVKKAGQSLVNKLKGYAQQYDSTTDKDTKKKIKEDVKKYLKSPEAKGYISIIMRNHKKKLALGILGIGTAITGIAAGAYLGGRNAGETSVYKSMAKSLENGGVIVEANPNDNTFQWNDRQFYLEKGPELADNYAKGLMSQFGGVTPHEVSVISDFIQDHPGIDIKSIIPSHELTGSFNGPGYYQVVGKLPDGSTLRQNVMI